MNKVVQTLLECYTILVMAKKKTIQEVPQIYKIGGTDYKLRELVEIEVAERTVNKLI